MFSILLVLFLLAPQMLVGSMPAPEPKGRFGKIGEIASLGKDPAEAAYDANDNPKGWTGNPKGVWGDYHNMWAADDEFTFSITGIRTTKKPHGYVSTNNTPGSRARTPPLQP